MKKQPKYLKKIAEQKMIYKPIKFEPVPNTTTIKVVEEYEFKNLASIHKIPVGFISDGASIPRPFWPFTYPPFHPKVITGAAVHDYLYRYKKVRRIDADTLASEIWEDHGAGAIRTFLMYFAIRFFGRWHYGIK